MLWLCTVKDNLIVHSRPIYDFTGLPPQLILSSKGTGVTAVDPKTGTIIWQAPDACVARTVGSAALTDDLVIQACGDGTTVHLHLRFAGLKRELAAYIRDYNVDRVHNGRLTRGRIPVYGANTMKATR